MSRSSNYREQEMTRLGLLGLTPFLFGALMVWVAPILAPQTSFALTMHSMVLAYGGAIAAYMAGVGAGGLLGERTNNEPLLPGMIVALIAWLAIWTNLPFSLDIPAAWRHAMILFILIYLLLRDLRAVADGNLPTWYAPLRMRLTFWAGLSISAIIVRLILWGYY